MGVKDFLSKINTRLLSSLRAFNPDLILMSSGFDAGIYDVGNAQHRARCKGGMDLQPSDYASITKEIMKVAEICCEGRLVSVLEGGYGRYAGKTIDRDSMAAMASAHISVLSGVDNPCVDVEPPGGAPRFGKGSKRDTYCICQRRAHAEEFMIECSNGVKCNGWIHPACFPGKLAELTPEAATELADSFECPWCRAHEGPTAAQSQSLSEAAGGAPGGGRAAPRRRSRASRRRRPRPGAASPRLRHGSARRAKRPLRAAAAAAAAARRATVRRAPRSADGRRAADGRLELARMRRRGGGGGEEEARVP